MQDPIDFKFRELLTTWGLLAFGVFVGILGKAAYRLIQNKEINARWCIINALLFGLIVFLAASINDIWPTSIKRMLMMAGLVGAIGDRLILIMLAFFERWFTRAVGGIDLFVGGPTLRPTVMDHKPKEGLPHVMGIEKMRDIIPLMPDLPADQDLLLTKLEQITGTNTKAKEGSGK